MWSDGARQLQVLDEMSHDPRSKLRPWLGKILVVLEGLE